METLGYELVEKEDVQNFHFSEEEILTDATTIKERKKELDRAISLGNLEHQKVKIYFADDKGNKVVHTTVWAVTLKDIVLKKNVIIPINRIIKLEI